MWGNICLTELVLVDLSGLEVFRNVYCDEVLCLICIKDCHRLYDLIKGEEV